MFNLTPIYEVLIVVITTLLIVAFVTVAERKTMGSMHRRLGPNVIGWYGILQAFADALKLILKENVLPREANIILFFIGPVITLIYSLLGFNVIPYALGLYTSDFSLGILYMLAVSSLATYGILLAGWSANSKYAFIGSLRSTAQLISYELILSSVILLVILLSGSLNLTTIIESQKAIYYFLPLFPIFLIFFIGCIAETNRAPFDLAEAESELVSGFMTEHSAVVFVFFFLAEYASIVLICLLTSVLFLGGYSGFLPLNVLFYIFNTAFEYLDFIMEILVELIGYEYNYYIYYDYCVNSNNYYLALDNFFNGYPGLNLALKTAFLIFIFIWARASFPRIRFDQLMSVCWTVLLPIIIGYIILISCIVIGLNIFPCNFLLL